MRSNFKRHQGATAHRAKRHQTDEERESALLAEFMRHDSVSSLAEAIAKRLGGNEQEADLIARAGLGLLHNEG